MEFRQATINDVLLLAKLNKQLVEDEKHCNRFMTISQLEERMREFIAGKYEAIIFEDSKSIVAYALYCDNDDHVYLRQLFVNRNCRRQGIGRKAIEILKEKVWPKDKRITVGVLCSNKVGHTFWKAVGFKDYAIELEMQ